MRQLISLLIVTILFTACNSAKTDKKAVDLNSNGTHIAYTSCGEGDTTLLFVHGWGINKEYWAPQLAHFCPRYKVVSIDLPGYGHSGTNRTEWEFDTYTDDIKNIIDSLQLKNVILFGHSMSGDIILNMSNKYPTAVIGIVGIDNLQEPNGPLTPDAQINVEDFGHSLRDSFDAVVSGYMRPNIFKPGADTGIINRVMRDVLASDSIIAAKTLLSNAYTTYKQKERMQGLQHKLYLVDTDMYPVKTDSLAKYCAKGVQVEIVHANTHYPMIETPDAFNAAVQKVINAIGAK
jgi:pimeloyl-ACP methyl ester carboxylesterase